MEKNNMAKAWDFKGWATRHNVKCGDGRTIKEGAFKDNDKQTVPLVWNHNHRDADNVLGHALLEYRKEGVYAYGTFNNTSQGQNAKELVRNKDITALSIYANKLKQLKDDVIHGNIRELSLVLAGSNPGAYIDAVMAHGDDEPEGFIIYNNSEQLMHSLDDDKKEKLEDEENLDSNDDENEDEKDDDKDDDKEVTKLKEEKSNMEEKEKKEPAVEGNEKISDDATIQVVFDTLTEEQKKMVYALISIALDEAEDEENNEDEGDEEDMKQNAFDKDKEKGNNFLTHAEFALAVDDAKRNGSLKEAFIAHGITDIETLFPETQAVGAPELITRDMEWVAKVMAGVFKSPMSRIRSTAANITADEARAKGYVKGNQKIEEVITVLKRTTTPTTVYKLQKIDRDDIIDITEFDVIVFLKNEMRVMLNEELARAFLIGDGRSASSDDKVNDLNIRPIYGDDEVYSVLQILKPLANATAAEKAKDFIQTIIRSRKLYKGSGNPSLYTTEDQLVEMLLLEDTNGRVIYDSIEKLQTALRVKEVVTVPVMENINRVVADDQFDLLGILVNLTDYTVGADKGGEVAMFEDFDLNFNKHEYLIETRCSGALKKPYSAIVFESKGTVVSG